MGFFRSIWNFIPSLRILTENYTARFDKARSIFLEAALLPEGCPRGGKWSVSDINLPKISYTRSASSWHRDITKFILSLPELIFDDLILYRDAFLTELNRWAGREDGVGTIPMMAKIVLGAVSNAFFTIGFLAVSLRLILDGIRGMVFDRRVDRRGYICVALLFLQRHRPSGCAGLAYTGQRLVISCRKPGINGFRNILGRGGIPCHGYGPSAARA